MGRPRLLDLFCGQGGASVGYHRAGFDVTGVDLALKRLPDGTFVDDKAIPARYPFKFIKADAFDVLTDAALMARFDAVHASPPCQGYSQMTDCRPGLAGDYPQMVDMMRARLTEWGRRWVIENVVGAGLPEQADLFGAHGLLLCGAMFGLPLYRHRLFEASFLVHAPVHPRHWLPASKAGHWRSGTIISVAGNCAPIAVARHAMGIDWMTRDGLSEAIPPAYTKHIGKALRTHRGAAHAAA